MQISNTTDQKSKGEHSKNPRHSNRHKYAVGLACVRIDKDQGLLRWVGLANKHTCLEKIVSCRQELFRLDF